MLKNLFKKYYYIRYQNLTYGKGLEYTTAFKGKGFAEMHKHCIQVEISKGNKVDNINDLQILDVREISKEDYDYFITQGNKTYKNCFPPFRPLKPKQQENIKEIVKRESAEIKGLVKCRCETK